MNTLTEKITNAILSSDTDDSNNIQTYYTEATIKEQKAIDRVFIALTGWTLKTLIDGKEAINYNPFEK